MQPLEFREIATLLNHSRNVAIDPIPVRESPGQWALYKGEYRVHRMRNAFDVLYMTSKASADSIRDARKQISDRTHVVYAASLEQRQRGLRSSFQGIESLWTTRQYLASFISEELDTYRSRLRERNPAHYVAPRIRVPAGAVLKIPNPLELVLRDPPYSAEANGRLAVVLADAGQGKTYMCDHLASSLLEKSKELIPIYVSAEQWHGMDLEDLGSLTKTILQSLNHYGAPIPWVDGCEDDFLRVSLGAGLFKIIFDGFDEYVLRNQGHVVTKDVLSALSDLSATTGTDIVVTSRTWFWESEVASLGQQAGGFDRYELEPFNRDDGKKYFNERFRPGSKKAIAAIEMYSRLLERSATFAGRGFVLALVADAVDRDATSPGPTEGSISWVMKALCEREQLRQDLPVTAEQQLNTLEHFAVDTVNGEDPSEGTLDLALQVAAEHLDEATRKACIRKMATHPLIREVPGRGSPSSSHWEITQSQIGLYLVARYLYRLCQESSDGGSLRRFSQRAQLAESDATDLATTLLDYAIAKHEDEQVHAVGALIRKLIHAERGADNRQLRKLITRLALRAVDKLSGPGVTHVERTSLLIALIGEDRKIEELTFAGSVSRFDFKSMTFANCRFENVSWANCDFDEHSHFVDCHVIGGSATRCEGLGLATWRNPTTDQHGSTFLNVQQVKAGKRSYSADDLRADLAALVDKFLTRGGGIRTVLDRNLRSGTTGHSPHRDAIIDEFVHQALQSHVVSGVTERAWAVRDDAKQAVKFYQANAVFTGPLKDAFERLSRKLLSR